MGWWGGVGSYPLLSQAPTHVEVELGCDNIRKDSLCRFFGDCGNILSVVVACQQHLSQTNFNMSVDKLRTMQH